MKTGQATDTIEFIEYIDTISYDIILYTPFSFFSSTSLNHVNLLFEFVFLIDESDLIPRLTLVRFNLVLVLKWRPNTSYRRPYFWAPQYFSTHII